MTNSPSSFISTYGRDETIARALESGAADYVVKPFSPTELLARVRAALRDRAEPETFALGELTIDYGPRRVTLADRVVPLTAIEFDLIRVLSLHAGHVVPTAVLLRRVWGTLRADNADRVRSAVKRLRKKLRDDADQPAYIFNVHGVGYRMPRGGRRVELDQSDQSTLDQVGPGGARRRIGRKGFRAQLFTQEPAADQLIDVMPRHDKLLRNRASNLLHVQGPIVIRLCDLFKDPVLDRVHPIVRRLGTRSLLLLRIVGATDVDTPYLISKGRPPVAKTERNLRLPHRRCRHGIDRLDQPYDVAACEFRTLKHRQRNATQVSGRHAQQEGADMRLPADGSRYRASLEIHPGASGCSGRQADDAVGRLL